MYLDLEPHTQVQLNTTSLVHVPWQLKPHGLVLQESFQKEISSTRPHPESKPEAFPDNDPKPGLKLNPELGPFPEPESYHEPGPKLNPELGPCPEPEFYHEPESYHDIEPESVHEAEPSLELCFTPSMKQNLRDIFEF